MDNNLFPREKFSKAARNYDEYALLQKEIAIELFDRIIFPEDDFIILDIGVGTGYLIERFQNIGFMNGIYAIDLAFGMLDKIKNKNLKARLIQADAKYLPFRERIFDLVVSNVAYQWVDNLNLAFKQVNRALKDKGTFYFSIFTDNTLKELRKVICEYLNSEVKDINSMGYLLRSDFIYKILQEEGFIITKIDLKEVRQYYNNLLELLYWLKQIGANKYWSDSLYKGLSSRNFINNISDYYQEKFQEKGKVFATFEILFVEAVKSQMNLNNASIYSIC